MPEAKINENYITIIGEDGVENTYDVLLPLELEGDKRYVLYSDMKKDENGEIEIKASLYAPDKDKFKLLPVESDKDFKMLEQIIKNTTDLMMEEK